MKIIVAGGRDFTNRNVAFRCLNSVIHVGDTIVSGHARGADTLGEMYAQEAGLPLELYPADWNKHGKAAGHIRNRQMAEVADALVAFWDGRSRGTANMIQEARRHGLEVTVFSHGGDRL